MLDSGYIYTGNVFDELESFPNTWWDIYGVWVVLAIAISVIIVGFIVMHFVTKTKVDHSIPRKVTFFGYDEKEFKYNSYIIPIIPTKEGYTFCGWYKDTAFLEPLKSTDRAKRDIILYPKWEKER